jgi:1,6-anhydro-N-acetylmuramate kinase
MEWSENMLVIGMMSGISVDGIDAALARIGGSPPFLDWELLAFTHSDYTLQL